MQRDVETGHEAGLLRLVTATLMRQTERRML